MASLLSKPTEETLLSKLGGGFARSLNPQMQTKGHLKGPQLGRMPCTPPRPLGAALHPKAGTLSSKTTKIDRKFYLVWRQGVRQFEGLIPVSEVPSHLQRCYRSAAAQKQVLRERGGMRGEGERCRRGCTNVSASVSHRTKPNMLVLSLNAALPTSPCTPKVKVDVARKKWARSQQTPSINQRRFHST